MKHLPFLIIFLALCGAGYYGYGQYSEYLKQKKIEDAAAQVEAEKLAEEKEAVSILQESHIELFKKDLKNAAQDYKDHTNLLVEIVNPKNFSTVEYAQENYDLFTENIEKTVRNKANKLLQVFTHYNTKLNALVDEDSTDTEKRFMQEWQEMHDVQLNRTIDLLSKDEQLLQAYGALIKFYYVHSKLYDVDAETEEFDFKREEDEKKHDDLLKAIREIRRDKATMRRKQ